MDVRIDEGWDDDDTLRVEKRQDEVPMLNQTGGFNCTQGSKGVMSLSFSVAGAPGQVPFLETLSAPSAVYSSGRTWTRGSAVGHGSLGTVFQAMDQETGQVFAVKEVPINTEDAEDLKFKMDLENEISICKDLSHPRIVSFLGHDYMNGCLYIYLEYMAGGSMNQVLSQFGPFDESLIAVYTREILEGLDYLHTREPPVVHRDIKGANVLVGLDCRVKLSDFGCSKRNMETMTHTMRGSIPWMAPEVIRSTGYGRMADIWSFGCVVIEMATAKTPWGHFDNPMAAMCKIAMSESTPPVPDDMSKPWKDFIRLCVQRDASKRPTAKELLEHELVRDVVVE